MPKETRQCGECGKEFVFRNCPSTIRAGQGKFCSISCSTKHNLRGKRSNNWRGGRKVADSGHVLVYRPDSPYARSGGYALEHRIVMAETLGRPLKPSEVVHHKDGNPANNDPANLVLLPSQSVHMSLHRRAS